MIDHFIKQLSANDSHDLNAALTLVQRVFHEFDAPDYSEEGIEQFNQFITYDSIQQQVATQTLMIWSVFSAAHKPIGVIALRLPNHISLLFVDPEFHKQGIARRLLETAILHSKTLSDVSDITLNSSPYALNAYKRLGFTSTDQEQTSDGIIFTPMKKNL